MTQHLNETKVVQGRGITRKEREGVSLHVQGCALRKIEGSPVL